MKYVKKDELIESMARRHARNTEEDFVSLAERKRKQEKDLTETINLPTIDIVQCKDCKRSEVRGGIVCYRYCIFWGSVVNPEGFCNYGEE